MVNIVAVYLLDVEIHSSFLRKRLEEMLEQPCVEIPDFPVLHGDGIYEVGPTAEIDSNATKRFIHGKHARAVPADSRAVTQSLVERISQSEAYILHSVVVVHVEISLCAQLQIDEGVLGQQVQHVIEERNARLDLV